MDVEEFNEWAYNLYERENALDVEIKMLEKKLAELKAQGKTVQEPILTQYVVKYK